MKDLINNLKRSGSIKNAIVELTMLSIDRRDFIENNPYDDCP